ncbi:MAG: hypothetical protein ACYSOZ_09765 [Planctomycetota bacterium]|jgi:hypothetical protein
MKQSPRDRKLEEVLRSTKLVAGGFMGTDTRHPIEIIEQDVIELGRLGVTAGQVAERMAQLTELAKPRLGNWIDHATLKLRVKSEDYKGTLVCPWPHPGRFEKRITTVEHSESGKQISWTDLNIHMIAEHGFFEGKGAFFRIEPAEIVNILFEDLT